MRNVQLRRRRIIVLELPTAMCLWRLTYHELLLLPLQTRMIILLLRSTAPCTSVHTLTRRRVISILQLRVALELLLLPLLVGSQSGR